MIHWIIIVVILVLLLGITGVSAQQDDSAAGDVIAEINNWRIAEGLWPLRQNTTLQAMAVAQAEYILSLPEIPDGGAIHTGRQGEGPKERAQQSPYNWPVYGRTDRVAVDEIGYVGRDARAAVGFWQGSTIHRTTALNPVYREIGVAALPHPYGHLYIAVLGGRPNVLPATVEQGRIYLSDERFYAPNNSEWIYRTSQIRLFDSDGKPLSDGWIPWEPVIPVPANAGHTLYIEYNDQAVQVMTEVSLAGQPPDTVVIPPTIAASPEPEPTNAPAEVEEAAQSLVIVVPTTTPPPETGAIPNVLVIYDSHSLAVFNNSTGPLDFSGLELAQGDVVLPASRWMNAWLTVPLNAFPAQDCLQVWAWNELTEIAKPSNCRNQRSVFYVDPGQRIWLEGSFSVRWQGNVLATCEAQDTLCEVTLP